MNINCNKKMLYQAKIKYPNLKLRLGEFRSLPFEDDFFDLVVSSYALHHLSDAEKLKAFKEMGRVLKSEGQILIGDLMFESNESKNQVMSHLTEREQWIIEDEYYMIIENMGRFLKGLGYRYKYQKIDKLLYLLTIKRIF